MNELVSAVPEDLTVRPLTMADAPAVTALIAASNTLDVGEPVIEEADVVGDWQRPIFDLATQSVGIFDGETVVGYAEVSEGRWATGVVHPTARGRGLGTALARWTHRVARRDGGTLVGQPVPEGSSGAALLTSLGYRLAWSSWVLSLPADREIARYPLPPGHTIRASSGDADERAAHVVIEDAFLEWADRPRRRFDDWSATTVRRPGYEPWHLRLLTDAEGAVVGALFLIIDGEIGFVAMLAVRRDRRGEGLARALLADAFTIARAHGATRSELSTDTRTGALTLYEHIGMEVTSTWVHLVRDLDEVDGEA